MDSAKLFNVEEFSDIVFRFPDEKEKVIYAHKGILVIYISFLLLL